MRVEEPTLRRRTKDQDEVNWMMLLHQNENDKADVVTMSGSMCIEDSKNDKLGKPAFESGCRGEMTIALGSDSRNEKRV